MLKTHKVNPQFTWIETSQLSEREKNKLLEDYDIPLEILDYVTDVYERSNFIVDDSSQMELLVLHMPTKITTQRRFISRPVSFLIHQDYLFTFNQGEDAFDFGRVMFGKKDTTDLTPTLFLLEAVNHLINTYLPVLREASKERHKLDDLLTQRLTNRDLVRLSYLQQTLTFLLSAAENNADVLSQLQKTKYGKPFNDEEKERLDDAMIEADQVAHMAQLESGIVDKIAHIFDSIMNNNLNDTMKFLTVWSLALAIPTLITGFYGMNINLPRSGSSYEWVYLILVSVVLIIWMIRSLKKKRRM